MSAAQSTVTYRKIPGFPGYRVGDDGSVWSRVPPGAPRVRGIATRRRVRRPWRRVGFSVGFGYRGVELRGPRGKKRYLIHRLVLRVFVGPCPPGCEVRHLNGQPEDNRLVNLRWGTPKENAADTLRHGRRNQGVRQGHARLNDAAVRSIRQRYAAGGVTLRGLAAEHGVSYSTIREVVIRYTWRHI